MYRLIKSLVTLKKADNIMIIRIIIKCYLGVAIILPSSLLEISNIICICMYNI